MKCLPLEKVLSAKGNVLHDWHAETIVLRAFNCFMLHECHRLISLAGRAESEILRWRGDRSQSMQLFTVREDLRFFMYCSEVPCGDASMELVMQRQKDATPWPVNSQRTDEVERGLLGRGSFSELSIVRRKPSPLMLIVYMDHLKTNSFVGRADSPITLSKSCSDKLALKQCTSLLSGPAVLLISPENAYLDTLILPEGQCLLHAFERAFGPTGRMRSQVGKRWLDSYSFEPFRIRSTKLDFGFSRRSSQQRSEMLKNSSTSVVWTPSFTETLINGVLQGHKQDDPRGASLLSRRKMMELLNKIRAEDSLFMKSIAFFSSYEKLKKATELASRRQVKIDVTRVSLMGWPKNAKDDFEISEL